MNSKICAINLPLLAVLLLTSATVLAQNASVQPAKQYSVSQGVIPVASEFFQGSSDRELDLSTDDPIPQANTIATNLTLNDLAPSVTQASSTQGQTPTQSQAPTPTETQTTTQTQPQAQTATPTEEHRDPGTLVGTVVSVNRQTMVVQSEDNQYHLFVFDPDIVRPKGLAPGVHVRVLSNSMDESGVRVATRVSVLEPSQSGAPPDVAPPPKEMLELQRDIEKEVRKWQLGVRVGAGLDPEIFLIGVHTAIGPIFSRDFYLRPNVEFGFGELTDMFAINLEGAYRLPINFRHGRWSSYIGAGPSLNFVHQGLERREVDFGNFEFESGLNIFSGVRFRRGTFAEVKANIWAHSVPTLRLIVGYTF